MFARTKRLTLRPGWPEDAEALAAAIGHESVAMRLGRVPWPYTLADARWWLAQPLTPGEVRLQILAHEGDATRLIGGIGLHWEGGERELGYWLTPSAWGRGYATEAARAVLDIARHAMALPRLGACYQTDNPVSGAVLRKLGFRGSGRTEARPCLARGRPVETALMEIDFAEGGTAMPIAA